MIQAIQAIQATPTSSVNSTNRMDQQIIRERVAVSKTKFLLMLIILVALLLFHGQAFAQAMFPTRMEVLTANSWGLEAIDDAKAARLTIPARGPSSETETAGDTPKERVIVAVIDTGIDTTHPDLRDHLWVNAGESGRDSQGRDKAHNQIDDDGNGFIDDVHGWNFVDGGPRGQGELNDKHGHGTHISGIIARVAPNALIMPLKYYDPKANEAMGIAHTVHAIEYAIKMKVNIINYSAGGPSANLLERKALEKAREQGILIVAAAGNEAESSDQHRYYPADYGMSNILSVTAIDPDRMILPTSNFGLATVHLAAPGESILSTIPGGGYAAMTGTSQATAFASGVAAVLLSQDAQWRDPERAIHQLIHTGFRTESLAGKTRARTCLNVYRSLVIRDGGGDAGGTFSANAAKIDPQLFASSQSPDTLSERLPLPLPSAKRPPLQLTHNVETVTP
jgi:subtilisin family serine protease